MSIISRVASALLFTTALSTPGVVFAQAAPTAPAQTPSTTDADPPANDQNPAPAEPTAAETASEPTENAEQVDVSVPGGEQEIVIRGTRRPNQQRSSSQVVNVLSSEQIARTGEGNIAGSLSRVSGLSVVGSGYVYVRGLGDRYSLALLNGSPLPSPEPLKRVVPLDLFPSEVISSSLVQKSYSVNYPGEFGGGVINLTTKATPDEPFLQIKFGGGVDTETTGNLGYTYYGSPSDSTGFDDGERNIPQTLQTFFNSGERLSAGTVDGGAIAGSIVTGRNSVVQRNRDVPGNWSGGISAGKSWDIGWGTVGVIGNLGYSNRWLTRDAIQQTSFSADLETLDQDFRRVITENRIVVNGLLGLGLEFDESKVRWTNLFIRDTLKQARLGIGNKQQTTSDFIQQDTAWYERQLFTSQVVGEFKFTPEISLDVRGGYANSQREAPFELFYEYVRSNSAADPFGGLFINRLNNGQTGDASVSFSDLNEDLYFGGVDLSYRVAPGYTVTVGGAYTDQNRNSSRRDFTFLAPNTFPTGVGTLRPDLLLQPSIIDFYDIDFIETNEGNPAFNAKLKVAAGYAKINARFTDTLSLDAGVRYEDGKLDVLPIQIFNDPGASTAGTSLKNSYWLPAASLTWQIRSDLQFRLSASKTIARPQFRELIFQFYFDPETNRQYQGNPQLVDSELLNAEARLEYYFGTDQRLSVSGFYKKLDKPIETFVANSGNELVTSFANAPEATLYGIELEAQKLFDLDRFGTMFASRRLVLSGNYTFTKSELKVGAEDRTSVIGVNDPLAADYFRDGTPLTGQSDHVANLQIGFENRNRLSQQTFLLNYASERVVSRGLNGSPPQPDVIEEPGLRLDFVAREGFKFLNSELEVKFEARNLTGEGHTEFQESGSNRIERNTYDLGRSFNLSATIKI